MEKIYPSGIAQLIHRHLQGTITDEDQARLEKWLADRPERRHFFKKLIEENRIAANLHLLNEVDTKAAFETLKPRIGYLSTRAPRLYRWIRYAAAALVACTASFFIWRYMQEATITTTSGADISAGGNRATLTIEGGQSIILDEAQTGIVVGDDIRYLDGSEVLATVSGQLTMTTPRGGTYQLTLPDGSTVWLNAASTISCPAEFSGQERIVRITGEAYFSVQKDIARPFKVVSADQQIEVLGTEFNLSAYDDANAITTTLVSGKIKITSDSRSAILSPGEQGAFSNGVFTKSRVDVESFIAWREGWISFHNKPFDQIMREVEHWYDIEVRYEGPVPSEIGYGMVPRTDNLSIVLALLEAGGIRFRLVGRTLVILNEGKEVGS